ncbi:MAG: hypothetical protein ACLRT5_07060 [Lachnospiraceae bacterium]
MLSADEIREYLNPVYDLERLVSRISYRSATPRDMISFQTLPCPCCPTSGTSAGREVHSAR